MFVRLIAGYTPPKTNRTYPLKINDWKLEDSFSFWDAIFSGAMLVSGRVTSTELRFFCHERILSKRELE